MTPRSDRLTDEQAEELLAKYRRMVWHLAYRLRRRFQFIDVEDLASEIQMAFVCATRTFDVAKRGGLPMFGLYAKRAGYRCGLDYCLRETFRGMHAVKKTRRSGTPCRVVALEPESVASRMPDESDFDQDAWWREMLSRLTDRQRAVLMMYYRDGLNQNEIAARLHVFQASVWRSMQAGLITLRKSLK